MANIKTTQNRDVAPYVPGFKSVLDEFFNNGWLTGSGFPVMNILPSVDIIDEEDKVLLKADMPGLEKNDIKVVVHDGLLSIEGHRNETREEKKKEYARTERFSGSFSRSFNLPTWAADSEVSADYTNGVLTITVPKSEQARPKEIEVKIR